MTAWEEERIAWYNKKINELVSESASCGADRFIEIANEVTNYQQEINRLQGVR